MMMMFVKSTTRALAIGQPPVVKDLQEHIVDIGRRRPDLVD